MENEKKQKVYLKKQCDCRGTSTTNQIRYGGAKKEKDSIVVTINLYPQPSCDICGNPG